MNMKTTRTLMLAAFAALSLGVGSAMAQEGGPSMPTVDYWAAKEIATRQAQVVAPNTVQSGSSDVSTMQLGAPVHFDFSTLANPG
jgi:hypothetical protein